MGHNGVSRSVYFQEACAVLKCSFTSKFLRTGTDKKVVAASRGRRRYWRKAGMGHIE